MGLLLSDTTLIDPMLDDTLRLLDYLSEGPYAMDAARNPYQHEAADPTE
jgi:hypothetical protein